MANDRQNLAIMVCGGADYGDAGHVFSVLDAIDTQYRITFVLHGAAGVKVGDYEATLRGADLLADQWTLHRRKPVWRFTAFAGVVVPSHHDRALRALQYNDHSTALVMFPGGEEVAARAEAAGVTVWRYA